MSTIGLKHFGGKRSLLHKKKHAPSEEMSLNITAMADIFTVILVFLLKSYATSALDISPTAGLKLPTAGANDTLEEAMRVEISENAILVDGTPIVALKTFQFQPQDVESNQSSKQLAKEFKRLRDRQLLIAKANSDVKVDAKLIVVSDQRVPYASLKTVLASAALNGYTDFKLAVVKND